MAADPTYQAKVHHDQGGDTVTVETGGKIEHVDRGTVTQATNKSTGVALNKATGAITMNGAALAAAAEVTFTVVNTLVRATDLIVVNHASAGTAGAYLVGVAAVAAGSFKITVANVSAGSLSEAIVLSFLVLSAA